MTPKENAEELYKKFKKHAMYWDCYNDEALEEDHAKQCAIICVEEIISGQPDTVHGYTNEGQILVVDNFWKQYWQSVKTEIENL